MARSNHLLRSFFGTDCPHHAVCSVLVQEGYRTPLCVALCVALCHAMNVWDNVPYNAQYDGATLPIEQAVDGGLDSKSILRWLKNKSDGKVNGNESDREVKRRAQEKS